VTKKQAIKINPRYREADMDDRNIKCGGCIGAIIAFIIFSFSVFGLSAARRFGLNSHNIVEAILAFSFFSILPTSLGYIVGVEGARSKSVPSAFINGAIFYACATIVFVGLTLFFTSDDVSGNILRIWITSISGLIISTGSLISGLTAIVVRDRQKFEKYRLIPQFTIQELLIITTLVAIIFSCAICAGLARE
jgi:uncharacterized membrane protein